MQYAGRQLDFRAAWEALGVSIPESDTGGFSRLLLCPHPGHANSRSPAFQANLKQPLCTCFAPDCFGTKGKPGTIEYAAEAILGVTHHEARKFLLGFTSSGTFDIEPTTRKRVAALEESEVARDQRRLESGEFTYMPQRVISYLESRLIDGPARGRWGLGWDERAERLVIPAFDRRGRFKLLIRRSVDGRHPKYLYTEGAPKSEILFGLRPSTSRRILVLVEGSLDVIVQHQGGVVEAAGTLGSGLSTSQVRLIHEADPQRIYLMPDRDGAGVANVLDAQRKLSRFPIFVCRYRRGSDPAEVGSLGNEMIERAIPMYEFIKKLDQHKRRSVV